MKITQTLAQSKLLFMQLIQNSGSQTTFRGVWPDLVETLENFPFPFPKTTPLTSVNNKQLGFQVEKATSKHPGTSAEPLVSREINLKFKYNLELAQSMFIV